MLIVDSVYGSDARAAARGDGELAWGSAMRLNPVGDSTTGIGVSRPSTVVVVSMADTSRSTRGRNSRSREAGAVAGDAQLVLGGTVDVVEHAAGQPSLGHGAQVVDVGGPGQAALDGVELELAELQDRSQGLEHRAIVEPGSGLDSPGPTGQTFVTPVTIRSERDHRDRDQNVGQLLTRRAKRDPGVEAIYEPASERRLSFADLNDRCNRSANALTGLGVGTATAWVCC